MKRFLSILLAAGSAFAAEEATTNAFDAFKIVSQRNIFDPNRAAPGQRREKREEAKPVRIDYLSLLGAMSYGKGEFAFFDGTASEYRKSVKAGDSIAGYKVARVTQTSVTLEAGGKTIEMPVGAQLKRQDEGEWKLSATADSFTSSGSPSAGSSSTEKKPESSGSEPSDALKRLLERRKQEK